MNLHTSLCIFTKVLSAWCLNLVNGFWLSGIYVTPLEIFKEIEVQNN